MALLKKIKASTLMETMVATTLIVILFMMASMTITNLAVARNKRSSNSIEQQLLFLQYQVLTGVVVPPHSEKFQEGILQVHRMDSLQISINYQSKTSAIKSQVSKIVLIREKQKR